MTEYLLKRLASILPTLLFVSMLIFGLQQLLPGDPAKILAGEEQDPTVVAYLRAKLHLDEPLPVEASALLKKLRAIGQREGERLEIVPELMLRKKTLEALLKSGYPSGPYQWPESLRGWRRELMGQALLDCLAAEGESA